MGLRDFTKAGRPRAGQWVHIDGSAYGLAAGTKVLGIIVGDVTLQHERQVNVQGIETHVIRNVPTSPRLRALRHGGVMPKDILDAMPVEQLAKILGHFTVKDEAEQEAIAKAEDWEALIEILKKCMLIPLGWVYHVDIVDPEKGTTIDSWAVHVEHLTPVVGPRRQAGDHPFEELPRDRVVSSKAVLRP